MIIPHDLPAILDEPYDDCHIVEGPDCDDMGEDAGELESGVDG